MARKCFLSTWIACLCMGMALAGVIDTYEDEVHDLPAYLALFFTKRDGSGGYAPEPKPTSGGKVDPHGPVDPHYLPDPYEPIPHEKFKEVTKCETEMIFNFDDKKNPLKEIRNRIWAGGVGNIFAEDGFLILDGWSFVEIPYFSGNDLRPAFFLSIVICPHGDDNPQAILSNSLSKDFASLTLDIEGNKVTLTVVERPEDGQTGYGQPSSEPIQLSVTINPEECTRINVEQDDKTILLSAGDETDHAPGRIPAVTYEPLYIGAGASAVRDLAYFTGKIDQFVFDKCPVETKH